MVTGVCMSSKFKPFILCGIVVLLVLPAIFSDKDLSNFKMEDIFSVRKGTVSDSPRQNPFDRYVERLKKFYNLDKKSPNDAKHFTKQTYEDLITQASKQTPVLLAQAKTQNSISGDDANINPEANIITGKDTVIRTATITTVNSIDRNNDIKNKNIKNNSKVKGNSNSNSGVKTTLADDNVIENDRNVAKKGSNIRNFTGGLSGNDLLFSSERDTPDAFSFIDAFIYDSDDATTNTVNLQKGTVLTTDNLLLQPTQEGYFYNGKFFKNGHYPRFANRKYVEGALNRYHTQAAGKLGKKATYFKDNAGNLTVSYVDQLPNSKIDTFNSRHKENKGQTLLASNKFRDAYKKYQGARVNGKGNMINIDVADASLQDMHSAYDLLRSQIQNGTIKNGVNIKTPSNNGTQNPKQNAVNNSIIDNFLNNASADVNFSDKPNTNNTPVIPSEQAQTLTIVMGDQNFSEDYAYAIHDLGCGTGDIFTLQEVKQYHIAEQMMDDPLISLVLGTCAPPLEITPAENIDTHISQSEDIDVFREKVSNSAKQSDKTTVKIVSTNRDLGPMVNTLNEEQSITNINGEPVTIVAVGPKEGERNLATTMESITNSVIQEQDKAQELNKILSEYYLTTQLKPTNTMLAFPGADGEVFVINDPNNSYWIKNPKEIDGYPKMYLIRNGVYYQGAMVKNEDVKNMIQRNRTNFLLVSDRDGERVLDNGTVLMAVKDSSLNINSFSPQAIMQNTGLVREITKIGDAHNSISNLAKKRRKKGSHKLSRTEKKDLTIPPVTPDIEGKI